MLELATSLKDLRFGDLMKVYEGSICAAASEWSELPKGFAQQLAELEIHQYLKDVFFQTPGAVCAVWEENGSYVCALRLEPYRDGWLLTALETSPEERRKGYAIALVREVQRHLALQGGGKLYSHVAKTNGASRKVHIACGFRELSDCAVYLDGSVDRRCSTLVYEC